MTGAAATGAALTPQARVVYDPARSVADLKAQLRAIRELCESSMDGFPCDPLAADVLAVLDGKAEQ